MVLSVWWQREAWIKSANSLRDIREWIEHLRSIHPLARVIQIVTNGLEAMEGNDHRLLGAELVWLLREAGRDSEALQVLDKMLKQYPDDVRHAISKTSLYLYSLDQPEDALRWIDVALERAHRTGYFRREALGVKARILLKLGRGDALSDILEEIMSLQIGKDVPDIGRERDFVDRAPPGFIRKNILDRYNEFRPKRPTGSLADEPPEYEPPDDGN